MKFTGDLHIHSKYSRATARNLDFENLFISARIKGITLISTGDFTHPAWLSEIKEKLVPAEQGLFKLREEIRRECEKELPDSCRGTVRFILGSEISNIYKRKGKTRKNHNLVFFPDMESVETFNKRLGALGNLGSDGRPILGLDARDLLEILLETSDAGFLIPAHIWTPWFSLFGSKSGFDTLEDCFGDLSSHIFALETGLSSDPAMNFRVSALDGLSLVSNSDAHSPMNLGREANLFDTDLSYDAVHSALSSGDPDRFCGTFEFYPQEGKYYMDGHRNCNLRLSPKKSMESNGICPVCGKPLTLGVLHRVEELADRPEGSAPESPRPFYNIIPLGEILSEITGVGPRTKTVAKRYNHAVENLGSEFSILHTLPADRIREVDSLLGEAVQRMRNNRVNTFPGYDGTYGKVTVFKPGEINSKTRAKGRLHQAGGNYKGIRK